MPTPAEIAASATESAEPVETPASPETRNGTSQPESPAEAATEQTPCNINQASADDLVALPGIGRALANRIIAHRDEHGPFAAIESLLEIQGIGPQNLQEFAHLITVDE
jgi:competence protein ComEA